MLFRSPEQQEAAGQWQADDGEQLLGDRGEQDAKDDRGRNAPEDDLAPLLGRDLRSGETDDDGVVAGQGHVDEENLEQLVEVVSQPLEGSHVLCQFHREHRGILSVSCLWCARGRAAAM